MKALNMNPSQLRLARIAGIYLTEAEYQEQPEVTITQDQEREQEQEQESGEEELTPLQRLTRALESIPALADIEGCEAEVEALIAAAEALSAVCVPVEQEDGQELESSELTEGASSYMFSKKSKELFDIDEDTYIEVKAESPIQAVIKAKELFKKDGYTGKIHLVS